MSGLPVPEDDGTADHLQGLAVPRLPLPATTGDLIDLGLGTAPRIVVYCYPKTGVPGKPSPPGWDAIPGAKGCTPQACAFRDHAAELAALGAEVRGLSTQTTGYQREMAERLHLPFPVLSDHELTARKALGLPHFTVAGEVLLKRLTLIIRDRRIEKVFYPVFPPEESAQQVVDWLKAHPL